MATFFLTVGQDGILRPIVNRPLAISGSIANRPQVNNLPHMEF
jgi:hypothetical protein